MAKVFSWKVAPGKYAYLEPENGSYIRSRITDSTIIHQMANTVNSWTEDEYREAFNNMKSEVNRVYGSITGDYSEYYSIGGINGGTVVLLAGKDGVDAKTSVAEQYINEVDYTRLIEKMDEEFEKYKGEIMTQVQAIKDSIENSASQDIGDALESLRQTREELSELRGRMSEAASKAQNALDAVRGLAMFSDGEIDPQLLQDIMLLEERFNAWTSEYDDKIAALLVDYDAVTQQLGSIALAMSTYEGKVSLFLENINALSGTVGTVEQTWAANSGMMKTLATWYNESAATYAEITRLIDASRAAIEDIVNFYNGETTSQLRSYIDGEMAEMGRTIQSISDSVEDGNRATVKIEERLNGLSGIVSTSISRYDSLSGRVCTINTEMDALAGSLSTAITVANNALQEARDMRDVWTQESGMLRSVTDLIIEVDENGDPIYYYVDPDLPDHGDESQWIRVYYIGDDPVTGLPIYNTKKDGTGVEYRDNVVPSYKAKMMSYILQNSNAIDLSVMSGDVISALRLAVTEDGSVIYMTADRVIIDSDVLVESLTAKAANVGGVHIGAGMISAQTGDNKWALGSDGILEATGAKITGDIHATSLTLGSGKSFDDELNDRLSNVSGLDETIVNNMISGYLSTQDFLREDALDGYVDGETLRRWLSEQSGLTSAYVNTIINAMSGSQINTVEAFPNGSGGVRHVITIGGVPYEWDTWDAGDFVLLNTEYSGETESGTAKFLVSKNGLLQANNAIIYGKIYASEGWFKGSVSATNGEFRGDVYANNGYFKGAISATTGYFSKGIRVGADGPTFDEYLDGVVASAMTSGMSPEMVNELITNYLRDSGITMDGYLSQEYFDEWVLNWNASHSANPLTEEEVQQLARAVVGSEITQVFGISANTDGSLRHSVKIGDRTYYWDTFRTEDYMLLGDWTGDSAHTGTGFCVSTDGLLEANNAIIYGKVFASESYLKGRIEAEEGYFRGSVSATDGCFKGSVSADNGYFHGDVVARSLTLGDSYGGEDISDYISGRLASVSGMDATAVNNLITGYVSSQNFLQGDVLNGYVTTENLQEWLATQSGITSAYINTIVNAMSGAQINSTDAYPNGSGGVRHVITIGGIPYEWDTWDGGDFVLINTEYSGRNGTDIAKFMVSKDGLLQANNAIIHGQIYATNGWFKGSVSATNGEFRGDVYANNGTFNGAITATSLTLGSSGNKTIEDYVDGRVADAVASGMDSSMVNQLITDYVNASGASMGFVTNQGFQDWVDQWNIDHPDNKIDATAASAIAQSIFNSEISKVFSDTTTNGVTTHTATIGDRTYSWKTVDTGDYVLLDTGVGTTNSAGTGGFIISKQGLLEAYNALIYGKIYASEGYFKGSVSAENGYFKGELKAASGSFKGSVSAENGYFKGELKAAKGSFSGALTATSLTLGGANYTSMPKSLSSGDVRHIVGQEATSNGWIKASDGYYQINHPVGENFNVSTDGLLVANNAILSGSVYATNGVFSGTVYAGAGKFKGDIEADSLKLGNNAYVSGAVYATKGKFDSISATNMSIKNSHFSGNVYANNGYFKGDIEADSLKLASNASVSGKVYATSGKFENGEFKKVTATNFSATNGYFSGKIVADSGSFNGAITATSGQFNGAVTATSGQFNGAITATSLTLGGANYTSMPSSLSSGDVRNIVNQAASTSGWIKQSDGYYQLGNPVGGDNFKVTTGGLLTANNAILSGSVYATNGVFSGTVYATNGKFKGNISADSGYFKGTLCAATGTFGGKLTAANGTFKGNISADSGYFKGTLCAATGTFGGKLTAAEGSFNGAVTATTLYVGNQTIASYVDGRVPNTSDFIELDETYGKLTGATGNTGIRIETGGLLTARNAVISGTVYATNGVFKGTVYANDGSFKGSVSASSLWLSNNASVSGKVYATTGKFENGDFKTVKANGFSAENAYIKGKVEANEGSFKGAISATSLWLSDSITIAGTDNNALHKDDPISAGGGSTYFNVSDNGQLTARNANIRGTLCAETGYFKGTLCAATGTFGGKLTAAEGSFKGAVSATTLYLGNQNITSIPSADGFLQLGREYNNMTVSTDGILLAQNAVVSGSIYATDGIFAGTVKAADVILDGKSLRFSSGSSNGLIISGGTIPIDYIPVTAKVPATAVTATTGNTTKISGNFGAPVTFTPQGSGSADMNIPSYKITLSNTQMVTSATLHLKAITQILTGSSVIYTFSGETYSYLDRYTSVNINAYSPSTSITVTAGKTYRIQRFYEADLPGIGTNPTLNISAEETSFLVPAAAPPSEKCVKIGSNGIQVSLGGGFYFTAADTSDGPIIAMAGRDTNGNMKTIKIDSNGLQIDR